MISRLTWYGSPASDAPNSSAPSVPCSPNNSAASTIRNRTPSNKPSESCGTCITRWSSATIGGSTRDDNAHDTAVNPTTLPTRISIPVTDTWWTCSPILKPISNRVINSDITTTVNICKPIGSRSLPSSDSTLATIPRLVMDRIPASASASVSSRSIPKS